MRRSRARLSVLAVVPVLGGIAAIDLGGELLILTVLALVVMLFGISASNLALRLYAWWTPQRFDALGFRPPTAPRLSFSTIVPARNEVAVLRRTVTALVEQDHPHHQIVIVVSGDDDDATRDLAYELAFEHQSIRVVTVRGEAKNKPLALNAAFPLCSGDIIGIMDAESLMAPSLLRHVDTRFCETEADVVQAGVQLMNFQSNWYSALNCLEYFFWFYSRLQCQAHQGFTPLGGNTVFMKREWVDKVGRWDSDCLAEDCEIGVRLSVAGAVTTVAYAPELATQEETPVSLSALLRQRQRWNQGFIQATMKGDWRRLPTLRQRLLAIYTLTSPFTQALSGVLIPLSILSALLLKLPAWLAMCTFLPLMPGFANVVVEAVGLRTFTALFGLKVRWRDYGTVLLAAFPYYWLLSIPAIGAAMREYKGVRTWDKTAHAGVHYRLETAPAGG